MAVLRLCTFDFFDALQSYEFRLLVCLDLVYNVRRDLQCVWMEGREREGRGREIISLKLTSSGDSKCWLGEPLFFPVIVGRVGKVSQHGTHLS